MRRSQLKSSPTDEHARRIARAITRGRPPASSADFDRYCESSPHEIFAALAGAAKHMPPAGKDEALALGYLTVLEQLLEQLRYRTDRGYASAAELIADFQADVVARVEAGRIDARLLAMLGAALHQTKIPSSPEHAAASTKLQVDQTEGKPLPTDVHDAFADMLRACNGDSFTMVGSLIESGHAMPAETRGVLADALTMSGIPEARSAAVLLLLDPDSAVRRAIASALGRVATSLTPTDVRRLIAMRNWRPENERAAVDAVIRRARAAGIDCAQWGAGSVETILATCIDGAATQGFLLLSPAGRKKRISAVLTKGGIADAWSGEPESRHRIEAEFAGAGMEAPSLSVSRPYLDRALAHHLALSTEKGGTPPLGLLQVAETIGGADWQPARMAFSEMLAGLIAEVPKAMFEPAALASVLRRSDELSDLETVTQSWFEDEQQIARVVKRARGGNRPKLAKYLLQSVVQRHRHKWAEIVLRTALWMREAPADPDPCWPDLALVAKALADGRDMTEIGLMRDIALRTIAVLSNDERT